MVNREMDSRLAAALDAEELALKTRRMVTREVQKSCSHPHLFETSNGDPKPYRVCLTCGFAEWDWYVGYQILPTLTAGGQRRIVEKATASECWRRVVGRIHENANTFDVLHGRQPETILWPD